MPEIIFFVSCPEMPDELFQRLAGYAFPGNVREVQAMAFEALARHQEGELSVDDFLDLMVDDEFESSHSIPSLSGGHRALLESLKDPYSGQAPISEEDWLELQRANLEAALRRTNGRISGQGGAAERLGLKPSTLESRLKSLGIDHRDFRER